jgi:hypothetical protein
MVPLHNFEVKICKKCDLCSEKFLTSKNIINLTNLFLKENGPLLFSNLLTNCLKVQNAKRLCGGGMGATVS